MLEIPQFQCGLWRLHANNYELSFTGYVHYLQFKFRHSLYCISQNYDGDMQTWTNYRFTGYLQLKFVIRDTFDDNGRTVYGVFEIKSMISFFKYETVLK